MPRYGPTGTGKVDLGILYLQPITANRVKGSPHADIEALRKQCKGVVVRQTCLVTTMWNEVHDQTEALGREGFLKDEFQKKNRSALVKRFDNQWDSAWDVARELARGECRQSPGLSFTFPSHDARRVKHTNDAIASNIVDEKPNEMIFVYVSL